MEEISQFLEVSSYHIAGYRFENTQLDEKEKSIPFLSFYTYNTKLCFFEGPGEQKFEKRTGF